MLFVEIGREFKLYKSFIKLNRELNMALKLKQEGSKAPQFTLKNQNGEKIALKDYFGKKNIVLYFYPRALTPGCTTQACNITNYAAEFKKLNTVVLGVSTDDVEKLKRFEEKKDLNFDLLSDPDHKVSEKYGAWDTKSFMGKVFKGTHRVTFLIDKKGKIVHVMEKVKAGTHHDDIIAVIKEKL